MELTVFNRTNTRSVYSGKSTLNVSIHGGIFSLSQTATKELGLKEGDRVLIAQQKDNQKKWFLGKAQSTNDSAFELLNEKDRLLFRCSFLSKVIVAAFKEETTVRFLITTDTEKNDSGTFNALIPIQKNL